MDSGTIVVILNRISRPSDGNVKQTCELSVCLVVRAVCGNNEAINNNLKYVGENK